jgi:DNA primase
MVEKDPKKFIEAVEKSIPVMEYFFQQSFSKYDSDKAEDKKTIAAQLLNIIKNFGNAIEKSHWIKKLSQKLDVSEGILIETLRKAENRFERPGVESEIKEKKVPKTRVDILREKIAGILLNDKILWEEVSNDPSRSEYFSGNPKFVSILRKMPENDYKFENFISKIEDKEERDFLQRIYFDTKYSITEEGAQENDPSDLRDQMIYCFGELRKELNKNRLSVLLRDIRKAEENGDNEGKILLINEFNKLSKEIT